MSFALLCRQPPGAMFRFLGFLLLFGAVGVHAQVADPASAQPESQPAAAEPEARPVDSVLEAQVELHRRGFSCGSIDGVMGAQTGSALGAFQRASGIAETGALDKATRARLTLTAPAQETYVLTPSDVGGLHAVPATWLGKSELPTLGFATAIELVAEKFHAHPNLIKKLNPAVDWNALLPGAKIVVPAVDHVEVTGTAAQVVISLEGHHLEVTDENSRVIAHFPVSIARMVEKRPVGELKVTVVIANPDYTFDPEVFPESEEGKTLGRRLVVPPGPNNPVGLVWIGLDRPGYGIHGTPDPEKIGRTESHGCFRLANWDAVTLSGLVKVGTVVLVE